MSLLDYSKNFVKKICLILITGCQVEDIEGNEGIHAANNFLVKKRLCFFMNRSIVYYFIELEVMNVCKDLTCNHII